MMKNTGFFKSQILPFVSSMILVTALLQIFTAQAQQQIAENQRDKALWTTDRIFSTNVFIEDLGQFENWIPQPEKILYAMNGTDKVFFTKQGLIFRFDIWTKEGDKEIYEPDKDRSRKKSQKKKKEKKRNEAEEGEEISRTSYFIYMQWMDCNPLTEIISSETVEGTYTFADYKKQPVRAKGFQKITYHDLYPGIDAVYTISDDNRFKYTLVVSSGADLSMVKMNYSGDVRKISTDRHGNLLITTPAGIITDKAPVSFDQTVGKEIETSFRISGHTVTFDLAATPLQSGIIIDPWTETPSSLDTGHYARDIQADDSGNVYVMGGSFPYKLAKYSASGYLCWTYTLSTNSYGTYTRFCVSPENGNCYIAETPVLYNGLLTSNPIVTKVNSSGELVQRTAPLGDNNEIWAMVYNRNNGKLMGLGGGIFTSDNLYYFADTTLTNCEVKNATGETCTANDLAAGVLDDDGTLYTLSAASTNDCDYENHITKHGASGNYETQDARVNARTHFDECYTPGGVSGFSPDLSSNVISARANCLALNANHLFSYNGKILKAWKKSDLTLLDSVIVDNSYQMGNYRTHEGLAADANNNVYAGGNHKIHHYYFNGSTFVFKDTIAVNDEVYDLTTQGSCRLYASGRNFLTAFDLNNNINIRTQPSDQYTCTGNSAAFAVDIYGSLSLNFRWQVSADTGASWADLSNGGAYSNVTKDTLKITSVTAGLNGNYYRCIISNACNTVTTSPRQLIADINIQQQPVNQEFCSNPGPSATFSVNVRALEPVAYQWQLSSNGGASWTDQAGGGPYSGMTTATMHISTTTNQMNTCRYRCHISNPCGNKNSTGALLVFVTTLPSITGQTGSDTVCQGTAPAFSITTTGPETRTYQWQQRISAGDPWSNQQDDTVFSGMATESMTISDVAASMNGYQYRCNVTSVCGSANSAPSGLTVKINLNGIVQYQFMSGGSVQPYSFYQPGTTTKIFLYHSGSSVPSDSALLQADNTYKFTCILPLSYNMALTTDRTFYGVNATDALLLASDIVSGGTVLSGIFRLAGRTRFPGSYSSADALNCRKRWVHQINAFPMGDWLFSSGGPAYDEMLNYYEQQRGITYINTSNIITLTDHKTLNIAAVCVGDVNGSRPFSIARATQSIQYTDTIRCNSGMTVMLPVYLNADFDMSAFSIDMELDTTFIKFDDVRNGRPSTDSNELIYAVHDGHLRISWMSSGSWAIQPDKPLFYLIMRTPAALTAGRLINVAGNCSEAEFAGSDGGIIPVTGISTAAVLITRSEAQKPAGSWMPNPMTTQAEYSFTLPSSGHVNISISNMAGECVATPLNDLLQAGSHKAILTRGSLSTGIYNSRFTFTDGGQTVTLNEKLVITGE